MTHTPGPWRIGDAGQTVFGPKTEHAAPVTIAMLPQVSPRVGFDERKANAKLMAAAPELLEALRDMVRYEDLPVDEQQPAVERARTAIAKATA